MKSRLVWHQRPFCFCRFQLVLMARPPWRMKQCDFELYYPPTAIRDIINQVNFISWLFHFTCSCFYCIKYKNLAIKRFLSQFFSLQKTTVENCNNLSSKNSVIETKFCNEREFRNSVTHKALAHCIRLELLLQVFQIRWNNFIIFFI